MSEQETMTLPRQDELTPNQIAFLKAFSELGEVVSAAKSVGLSRWAPHYWKRQLHKERDPVNFEAYAEAWAFAKEVGHEVLVAEAHRRAVVGTQKYKFTGQGQKVMWTNPETGEEEHYCEREYSDWMLGRLLEAHRPEQFSQKHQHQLTGQVEIKRVILEGE